MKALRIILLFLFLFFLFINVNCQSSKFSIHSIASKSTLKSPHFLAGAAQSEITAMPGYPLGGFGPDGNISLGIWTHLYAHAIYFEDTSGQCLVIASCDLWAMPAGLCGKVAEIVSKTPECSHIGRDRIILSATHTHFSQGNFMSSRAYNELGSGSGGFDRKLMNCMAARIAETIITAYRARTNASIEVLTKKINDLTRNRSFHAFLENSEAQEILHENRDISPDKKLTPLNYDPNCTRGVNPNLQIIVIRSLEEPSKTIALICSFPMHQTALGIGSHVYCSDVYGIAELYIKKFLRDKNQKDSTVVGFFNSEEADVSPNWYTQNNLTVQTLGERLADNTISLLKSTRILKEENTNISGRLIDIPLASQRVGITDSCVTRLNKNEIFTAAYPDFGLSMIGGSRDGYSSMHGANIKEGIRLTNPTLGGQGVKVAIRRLLPLIHPAIEYTEINDYIINAAKDILLKNMHDDPDNYSDSIAANGSINSNGIPTPWVKTLRCLFEPTFPETAPIGVYEIGHITIAALPGEFTTTLGYRIRKSLLSVNPKQKYIFLIGLANEYVSYFTTPCEYEEQRYEGGATLYGAVSGLFLQQELSKIADPRYKVTYKDRTYKYDGGDESEFGIETLNNIRNGWGKSKILNSFVNRNGSPLTNELVPVFELDTIENSTFDKKLIDSNSIPLVRIEVLHNNNYILLSDSVILPISSENLQIPQSNFDGLGILSFVKPVGEGKYCWCAAWINADKFPEDNTYRFVAIYDGGRRKILSIPFTPSVMLKNESFQIIHRK